jgi:Holliday junction resolvase RusA-like endonuclease
MITPTTKYISSNAFLLISINLSRNLFSRIEFVVPLQPKPQMQRRYFHQTYWNPSFNDQRNFANYAAQHRPPAPYQGPLEIELEFKFRAENNHAFAVIPFFFNTRRPDLDNLVKLVFDALKVASFYNDDCQVVRLIASKVFAEQQGTRVVVRRL